MHLRRPNAGVLRFAQDDNLFDDSRFAQDDNLFDDSRFAQDDKFNPRKTKGRAIEPGASY
jgi:hypothetical protein